MKTNIELCRLPMLLLLAGSTFAQQRPIPLIDGVSPNAIAPGSGNVTIAITGANFSSATGAYVLFNRTVLSPATLTADKITVLVPAVNVPATAGTATIQVFNKSGIGGGAPTTSDAASNVAYLPIANPVSTFSENIGNSSPDLGNNLSTALVTGDFNNDSIIDVAVGHPDGSVQVFLGDGTGQFTPVASSIIVGGRVTALAVGDFNKDGHQDIVIGCQKILDNVQSGSSLALYLGKGDGTFSTGNASAAINIAGSAEALAVADFGGDGNLDVSVVGGEIFQVLNGDGIGGLSAGPSFKVGNTPPNVPAAIAIGDFNGDGLPDAAVPNTADNTVTVLLSTKSGFLSSTVSVGSKPTGVAVADFNHDGFQDILTVNTGDASTTLLAGKGNGTFTSSVGSTRSGSIYALNNSPSTSLVTADFNADGNADIAIYDGNVLTFFLGDGAGHFNRLSETAIYTYLGPAPLLVAADLNGDGYPDLVGNLLVVNLYFLDIGPVLTVPPGTETPIAVVTPSNLNFSSAVGNTSASQLVVLTNNGAAPLNIRSITATGPFSLSQGCESSVAPHSSCSVYVSFTPTVAGTTSGTLTFTDNSSTGATQVVTLTGTTASPKITANPGSLSFSSRPKTKSAPQTITISNNGSLISNISGISVSGTGAASFAIASNTCRSTLAVGANCKVSITFTGPKVGSFAGQLNIASDGPAVVVSLSGSAK